MLTAIIRNRIKQIMASRPCDLVVDVDYMERWYLIPRNRFFNVYAHKFTGSDAPTPHDHPWVSVGMILEGKYREHTPVGSRVKRPGSITLRFPKSLHWIELMDAPVYTLFITGPRIRNWGFQCDTRWVDHMTYINTRGSDRLASGCGEE